MNKKRIAIGIALLLVLGYIYLTYINQNFRGFEYAPDMAYSPVAQPYTEVLKLQGDQLLDAPEGKPLNFQSTEKVLAGQTDAEIKQLENPLPFNPKTVDEGQQLYQDFCSQCHGAGDGKGELVKLKKYPPPPSFRRELKDRSPGELFYSISYGKNYMGAYQTILSVEERWKIVHYLTTLQIDVFD